MLIASARMYGVAPGAVAAWGRLLAAVSERAGVPLQVIEHAYPAPLDALWQHPELGCAFMCGWPLALEDGALEGEGRPILAAPVPDAAWSAGAALYRSEFLVAAGSAAQRVEDAFGGRFAFNAPSSHSGVNMPRAFLSRWADRAPLFADLVGPLITPRRCIEAVLDGRAEITAVDSYALQLLRRHDPALGHAVRVVGATDPSPIPPLVGGRALPPDARDRLEAALTTLADDVAGRALLADVCLLGFQPADHETYRATLAVLPQAQANNYPALR